MEPGSRCYTKEMANGTREHNPKTGFYIEDDPSNQKFTPDQGAQSSTTIHEIGEIEDPSGARRDASRMVAPGSPARADTGAPAGAGNALLFHGWKDGSQSGD